MMMPLFQMILISDHDHDGGKNKHVLYCRSALMTGIYPYKEHNRTITTKKRKLKSLLKSSYFPNIPLGEKKKKMNIYFIIISSMPLIDYTKIES